MQLLKVQIKHDVVCATSAWASWGEEEESGRLRVLVWDVSCGHTEAFVYFL